MPTATALSWEWIVERLVDFKEIEIPLLKALIMSVPDINSPFCTDLHERIMLRYLEEVVFSGKFEAHAIHAVKTLLGLSSQNLTDAEDLLLGICTEVVLSHIREVDADGERDWEGFESDLNHVFGDDDLEPLYAGRRHELVGLLKDKSSYLLALEKYPVEVLKNDLLHFIKEKKTRFSKTIIDKLVCDIPDGHHASKSFLHIKNASTGDEIIKNGSRKRSSREATLDCDNEFAEGQKKLKKNENDLSPLHRENIKECIVAKYNVSETDLLKKKTLDSQAGNLNQNPQNRNDSLAMGSTHEVNCNRVKEIPLKSSSAESTDNRGNWNCSKSTENEDHCLEQKISEREEEHILDIEGIEKNHIFESEELPDPDHLILGNDCHRNRCFKCKDGGSLFLCNGCSVALHYSCLQSPVSSTSKESVGCPVCSYKKDHAAYTTAKKEVLESKKRLLAFINIKAVQGNIQNTQANCKRKKQVLPDTGDTSKDHFCHPCAFDSDSLREKPSPCSRSSKSFVHENEMLDNFGNDHQSMQKDAQDGKLDGNLGESHGRNRKNKIHNQSLRRSSKSIIHENEISGGIENKQQFMQTEAHDCTLRGGLQENHYGTRRNRIRNMKSSMRESFPLHGARRAKLPWTKEEEEILKEGMNKFPCRLNKIPWKHILEHGRGVFHKSRNPSDLKDKWRNMNKGSS